MKPLTSQGKRALEYIRNAGGSPTVEQFDDDHEPIGRLLRADLHGYIEIDIAERKISLSKDGNEAISLTKEDKRALK